MVTKLAEVGCVKVHRLLSLVKLMGVIELHSFINSGSKPLILGRKLRLEKLGRGLRGKEEMCIHATNMLVVYYLCLKWRKVVLLTQSLQF